MRLSLWYILALAFVAACTIQQQNGGDIQLQAPPVFGGQQWQITRQDTLPNGERICRISIGELEVIQRGHNTALTQQVALSTPYGPGYSYKLQVNQQHYETRDSKFSPKISNAIIDNFLSGGTAYTELRSISGEPISGQKLILSNKIPLEGFELEYNRCATFLRK